MPASKRHAEEFLAWLRDQKSCSTNTLTAYRKDILRFRKFILERSVSQSELKKRLGPVVREFNRRLGVEGLSNRSICRVLSAIKSYFKYLHRKGITPDDLGARIMTIRFEKKLPRYLLETDIERLMQFPDPDTFQGSRDLALIELLYSTGCRLGEMPTVRIDDLDLEGGCVRIFGKGRKERLAPIGEYARTAINNYLEKRIAKFPDVRHNELFLNRLGGALTRRSMSRIVWKYTQMLGTVDPFSPHKLRHSFATHLLDRGADIMAIKEMLGHTSLSSTQIYSSVTLKRLKKAYKNAHPRA